MLRIEIKYWPGGDESKEELIGTADITKDGTGDEHLDNYSIMMGGLGAKTIHKCRVKRFPRHRSVWELLYLVLRELVGDRNP